MLHRLAGLALAAALLLVPATASAAPVTVNVRIEGSAATLFEGPVTTDAKPAIETRSSGGPHPCDVGENQAAPTATRAGTPTTALVDAASSSGLFFDATWSPSFFDFLIDQVGPDVAGTAFWALIVNNRFPDVGGCQIPLSPGDDVLWAFDGFGKTLLQLTGPATATAGTPFTVTVRDATNGNPVAGATVGGATTSAAGTATVTLTRSGVQRLKAEAPNAVRSNALVVTVPEAGTPAAGQPAAAPDRTAPRARVLSPRDRATYRIGRFVPRTIRVAVDEAGGSGVRTVKLRLTRRVGNRCFSFSGRRERFIGVRCGRGFFFTVSDRAPVSYLLPQRLGRGRYVLDAEAIDRAFNRDVVGQRGRNRSVFTVR
jgi:hypothetical protein